MVFASLFANSKETNDGLLFLDRMIQAVGVIAAGAAGWFALEDAMGGTPWPYFALMGVLAGLIMFAILFGEVVSIACSRLTGLISRNKR